MSDKKTQRVTIRDVAKISRVHYSTVSRILNADPSKTYSPEVVRRVQKAAARLGYRVNRTAASLRKQRSHAIGFIISDVTHPMFPPMLKPIEEVLLPRGYIPILANSSYDSDRQLTILDTLLDRQIDGVILTGQLALGPMLAHCESAGIPAVLVMGRFRHRPIACVTSDDKWGARLCISHLMDLGHRNLAYVAGPTERIVNAPRLDGFLSAAKDAKLKLGSKQIYTAYESSPEAGEVACKALLGVRPRPTAVVAANDFLALGCIDAVRAIDLCCPDDVSIVSHNDLPLATLARPKLTAIHISFCDVGREAAELLLRRIEGVSGHPSEILLPPSLIVRDSTGPVC